jgi:hypothetical protein
VKMCLQIGDYHLKSHMFSIDMGGCDIVLGANWLRTLGPILMDLGPILMDFNHRMEKLLKKGHSGVIAQLHAIQATKTPSMPQELQAILSKHQLVFSTPQGLPPSCGVHDHSIPLYQEAFLLIYICIVTPFPKKMKLRKWSRNSLMQVLSALVRAPIHLLWSWS